MKAMQCDRAGELIGAYIDQELDAATRREVAAHVGSCPACSTLAEELRGVGQELSALGREPAPDHLVHDVQKTVAHAAALKPTPWRATKSLWARKWLAQAAMLLVACSVTAAATTLIASRMADM